MVQLNIDPLYSSPELHKKLQDYGIEESIKSKWTLTKSTTNNWLLFDTEKRKLEIDFDLNKKDYQRTHKGSGELIARALGIKDGVKRVVDLTVGLGIDSVFLARLGFQVTGVERNPLMVFLLHEAQKKTKIPEVKNIKWLLASAVDFLSSYKLTDSSSCYYDPMYPEKKKSALPRQEMVIFRELVGADEDSSETLRAALKKGFTRTVVKRPVKSEVVVENPDFQLASKLVRFDVYYPRFNAGVSK